MWLHKRQSSAKKKSLILKKCLKKIVAQETDAIAQDASYRFAAFICPSESIAWKSCAIKNTFTIL